MLVSRIPADRSRYYRLNSANTKRRRVHRNQPEGARAGIGSRWHRGHRIQRHRRLCRSAFSPIRRCVRAIRPSLTVCIAGSNLWDETQICLKTLSHNTILRGRAALMRADMAKLKKLVKNDELVEFMREFTSEDGLSQARVERATSWTDRALGELDERLEEHQWLAGDAFSLADLVWSIDIHRFELINLPMEK